MKSRKELEPVEEKVLIIVIISQSHSLSNTVIQLQQLQDSCVTHVGEVLLTVICFLYFHMCFFSLLF
jgi:hypothetical protein